MFPTPFNSINSLLIITLNFTPIHDNPRLKNQFVGTNFSKSNQFCFNFHKFLGTAANGHPVSYWNRSFFGLTESYLLTILILKKQSSPSITAVEIASTTPQQTQIILNFGQRSHVIIVTPLLSKSFIFRMFQSTLRRNAGVFKFLRF